MRILLPSEKAASHRLEDNAWQWRPAHARPRGASRSAPPRSSPPPARPPPARALPTAATAPRPRLHPRGLPQRGMPRPEPAAWLHQRSCRPCRPPTPQLQTQVLLPAPSYAASPVCCCWGSSHTCRCPTCPLGPRRRLRPAAAQLDQQAVGDLAGARPQHGPLQRSAAQRSADARQRELQPCPGARCPRMCIAQALNMPCGPYAAPSRKAPQTHSAWRGRIC